MAASQRIAGVTSCTIDGATYNIGDACTWTPCNVDRETAKGLSGVAGYIENIREGQIKVTLFDSPDLSVSEIMSDWTSVSVQIVAANGKVINGSNMWATEAMSVSAKEGTFEVVLEGPQVTDN